MKEFLMMVIVPVGFGDNVINAAYEAGATGATIMRARGADHSKHGLFSFKVEPEEEVILIAASKDTADNVGKRIYEEFEGKRSGSVYITPISRLY